MKSGGFGLRLAAVLATQPGLLASRGPQLLGELGRIAVGNAEAQLSGRTAGSPTRDG